MPDSINEDKCLGVVNLAGIHDFISESRKIADLYYSSMLVRDAMKHVMAGLSHSSEQINDLMIKLYKNIQDKIQNVRFIIPPEELLREKQDYSFPNQLLFSFQGDPKEMEDQLQEVVKTYFKHIAEESLKQIETLSDDIKSIWRQQWSEGLPLFSTWVPWSGNDNFEYAHHSIQKKLAGHKMNRQFSQWQGAPVPKCIQCGRRECIGSPENASKNMEFWKKGASKFVQRNIIKDNERLCAVCLGKRILAVSETRTQKTPTTTLIAALPFLHHISKVQETDEIKTAWNDFQTAALKVGENPLLKDFKDRFSQVDTPHDHLDSIKKNAEWFYENFYSIHTFKGLNLDEDKGFIENLRVARKALKMFFSKIQSKPAKYLAIIEYDGDKMGKRRGELSLEDLKKLSGEISALAHDGVGNVFLQHNGFLIYSGGEDVLGFSSMENALPLVKEINSLFRNSVNRQIPAGVEPFTGSGSVTFFPHDFSLQMALQVSHDNLLLAKEEFERNALVVGAILPDASQYISGRKWEIGHPAFNSFLEWLESTLELFAKNGKSINGRNIQISRKFLYELMKAIEVFKDKQNELLFANTPPAAFKLEAKRLIKQHINSPSALKDQQVTDWIENWVDCMTHSVLSRHHAGRLNQGFSNQEGLMKLIDFYHHRVEGN